MIAVIFEVFPAEGRRDEYLDIAAAMRPMVEEVDGFISVERFQSLTNPDKLLSISFFEDEARWIVGGTSRPTGAHRQRAVRASSRITGSRSRTCCGITECSTATKRPRTARPPTIAPAIKPPVSTPDYPGRAIQKELGHDPDL